VLPDDRAVEDYRLNADERTIPDGAPMNHGLMADGDVLPDVEWKARIGMQHRAFLHIAGRAYGDGLVVGADYRPGPHAGSFAENHAAYEGGLGRNEGAGRNLRDIVVELVDGHRCLLRLPLLRVGQLVVRRTAPGPARGDGSSPRYQVTGAGLNKTSALCSF